MSENNASLCPTCGSAIWCDTWGQFKCVEKKIYITGYKTMTVCGSYKKRPKGFKEPACQCEDCLKNELLTAEMAEEE